VKAWTAGGLRAAAELSLPVVQLELFTEAGAIVAARLARNGAAEKELAAVLQRAANQARRLASQRRSCSTDANST
jgi:hypothetical protein